MVQGVDQDLRQQNLISPADGRKDGEEPAQAGLLPHILGIVLALGLVGKEEQMEQNLFPLPCPFSRSKGPLAEGLGGSE